MVMAKQGQILNCASKDITNNVNCTNAEIIPPQWGESKLTYQVPMFDNFEEDTVFIPKAWSVFNWGGVPVPGIYAPPELSAYSEPPYYNYWDREYTP
jgi:hypothetical protein